jgi:hypothetical protein
MKSTTSKSKPTTIWKRYQYCGGPSVFGTQCFIEEEEQVVHCSCGREQNLKGFDWTIIFYFFQMAYTEKIHLVDRYNKDKRNRTQEQAWQDMSIKFNREMNFVKEEDIKNGTQLKDFLFTACGKLHIRILP